MDFRILGPIEAIQRDRPVALGGSKQRALLGILLLHVNEPVSNDRLIDELWPGERREDAIKSLQVAVSRLRKALDPKRSAGAEDGVVVTRSPGYELRVDPARLDATRFESLVKEGQEALSAGDSELARERLDSALQLWRGPPLADLTYEAFAQAEIARLEELRTSAFEHRIQADLDLGRHDRVVGELEGLVAEHPLRERLRALLMLALYRAGRQGDALEAYQTGRAVLVEELGIEPGRELRDLHQAILEQSPALDLAQADAQATEPSRGVFVGRERELAELIGGLDDAFGGRGRLFLISGEPGMGKSRLAEELIAYARSRGAEVLVGRCWEAGGAPAYWPWVQALRALVREADAEALRAQLGARAAELGQLVPELAERLPDVPEPADGAPDMARFRLFDAVTEFLRNAAETQPVVLALDDLHAADAPSLLLLRFLTRELAASRILVVAAYRDADPVPGEPLAELLAEVSREAATRRLSLVGLSAPEVVEYVELLAPDVASEELVAALHAETEGNPLFLGEILRLLLVEGAGPSAAGGAPFAIPQSVRDVTARRLGHLSAGCNELLVLAAVLGREFSLAALARMGAVSDDELLETLEEAMVARVVSDLPGGRGWLRFAHALIRETLYDGLPTTRRVRLHRLAVEALERLYGDEPGPHLAELAHHCVAGSDFEKGLEYARQAGDRALDLLAFEEGARQYETALEALELARPGDRRTRCELLLSLGEAEARAGNTPAAKGASLAAAELARRLGLPNELARAAGEYGGRFVWNRAGPDTNLVPLLEEGLAALPEDNVRLRVQLLSRLAGALRDDPARDRRESLSAEALALARRVDDPVALVHALNGRAAAVVGPDTVEEGLAIGSELREAGERIGDRERMLDGHFVRIMAELQLGDIAAVEADLEAAARIAEQLRQPTQLWEVCAARAMLALAAGDLDEGERLMDEALVLGERAQPAEAIPVHRIQRYTLYDFRDGLAEVEPSIAALIAEYPARPVFRCVLTHVHARLGRADEARARLVELVRDDCAAIPFDQEWLYAVSLLAGAAALVGDADAASVVYRMLLPWAGCNAADHAEGIRGAVSRYLGLLAPFAGHESDAARHFDDALDMNARMGARPWLERTRRDYEAMRGRSY